MHGFVSGVLGYLKNLLVVTGILVSLRYLVVAGNFLCFIMLFWIQRFFLTHCLLVEKSIAFFGFQIPGSRTVLLKSSLMPVNEFFSFSFYEFMGR